jgi:hypothetical protein
VAARSTRRAYLLWMRRKLVEFRSACPSARLRSSRMRAMDTIALQKVFWDMECFVDRASTGDKVGGPIIQEAAHRSLNEMVARVEGAAVGHASSSSLKLSVQHDVGRSRERSFCDMFFVFVLERKWTSLKKGLLSMSP